MSRLQRTFSDPQVLDASPATSPIITHRELKPMPLQPTTSFSSPDQLFELFINPDALEAQPSAPNMAPPAGLMGVVGTSADAGRITPMASASGLFAGFENDNTLFSSFIPSDWSDPQVQALPTEYAFNPSSPSSASTSSLTPLSSAQVSPTSFMQELQEQDAFQFEASASDNHHAYINPSAVFMAAQLPQEQAWQTVVSQPVSEPAFVPVQYTLPVYEVAPPVQQASPVQLPMALSSPESEDMQVSRANKTAGVHPSRRSGRKTISHHHPYRQGQDTSEDESEDDSRSGNVKKPFACNVCGTRFCRDFERVRHMKAHNNQNLNCGICNKTIKNGRKDALRRHQLRTRKCVAKQAGLSDEELVLRGCVTSVDRAQWESRTKSAGDEDDE